MPDRTLLYASAFVRAVATGQMGLLLALHLSRRGLDPFAVGLVVSAGLAGAAAASLLATLRADAWGRRRTLAALAAVGAAGGIALAAAPTPATLALAAFVGMANGMGRDRGAALVLEQAALPATTTDAGRTRAFAVYNVLQDAGHALGSLLAGLLTAGTSHSAGAPAGAFTVYALLVGSAMPLALALSAAVEAPSARPVPLSAASRRILLRLTALFGLDSLGGGFLTTAMLAVFFHERFGVDESALGPLFAAARLLNGLSHLGAAWLARRIGLVNTMVFTHLPSSLLLATVAIAPTFPVAAVLFLVREGLVEMDVPTRQSYVMAVVRPEERTWASGVTHLVRMGAWALAPALAGAAMRGAALGAPLVAAAALKIAYDVLLYLACRGTRPPEEGS